MPNLSFTKWSPGGNTTVFLPQGGLSHREQARLARQALAADMLGGEQAGFVDVEQCSLRMAGGEFCCNATRAFGALLVHENGMSDEPMRVRCSGWPGVIELDVMGVTPSYTVTATLELPSTVRVEDCGDAVLVRLPGIDHLLLNAKRHRVPADAAGGEPTLVSFAGRLGLEKSPCVGAIWWSGQNDTFDMTPLVHVRAVGTTFLESSCGSGALALALWLASRTGQGTGSFSLGQPSGQPLFVEILRSGTRARISGPVTLLAQGQVWLDA